MTQGLTLRFQARGPKRSFQKTAKGQAEHDPDLPCSASDLLGKVESHLYLTVAGQVEMPTGQANFRGSLPRSENILSQATYVAPCRMPHLVLHCCHGDLTNYQLYRMILHFGYSTECGKEQSENLAQFHSQCQHLSSVSKSLGMQLAC